MAVMPSIGSRGLATGRILPIAIVILILIWFRDVWFPPVYEYSSSNDTSPHETDDFENPPSGMIESVVPDYTDPVKSENDAPDPTQEPSTINSHIEILLDTSLPSFAHTSTHHATHTPTPSTAAHSIVATSSTEQCRNLPGADRVMVMLKTGATELYQKLPTHFMTTFRCIPHFMIFSDSAGSFADVPIHDAIAPISSHWKETHEDFDTYNKIADYQATGQDLSGLKGEGGWNLDKWKFLPMLTTTFAAAPPDEFDWYVMIEADTSLGWTNLLLWLARLDPATPHYLGAQNWIGDTTFGHGGSGIVISSAAAAALLEARLIEGAENYDARWEEATSRSCCGDEIVARALKELGILLDHAWPLIQGETPSTLDWTEGHWCAPPVSWHHVTGGEVDRLWRFERAWEERMGADTPYLYRDVYRELIAEHVMENRSEWNNLSRDFRIVDPHDADSEDENFEELEEWEQSAIRSEAACAETCARKESCVQWMFKPGRCQLGWEVRFGHPEGHDSEHFASGWIVEKIEAKLREKKDCHTIRWEPSE